MTPSDLVAVAEGLLAPVENHLSEAAIRRSVSTSYYALFRALNDEVAGSFMAPVKSAAHRLADHASAAAACRHIAEPGARVPWLQAAVTCHPGLQEFAAAFLNLQQARLEADYDASRSMPAGRARSSVDRAARALGALDAAKRRVPEQVQALCIASIARSPSRVAIN